jgi:hypothetical protein
MIASQLPGPYAFRLAGFPAIAPGFLTLEIPVIAAINIL